jgi:hypothetical protein
MKQLKQFINEALKINSKSKVIKSFGEIESSEPGSRERSFLVLKLMREKYGDRFDNIYTNNNNDICIIPSKNFNFAEYFVVVLSLKEGYSIKYYFGFTKEPKIIDNIEDFNNLLKELDKFIKENKF